MDKDFFVPVQFQGVNKEIDFSPNTTCTIDANMTSYCSENPNCDITCSTFEEHDCLYGSITFWGFILLMSLGNIGFNVSNCISDAICFDILGISYLS